MDDSDISTRFDSIFFLKKKSRFQITSDFYRLLVL